MSYRRGNDEEDYRSTEKIYPNQRDPRHRYPRLIIVIPITITLTLVISLGAFRLFSSTPTQTPTATPTQVPVIVTNPTTITSTQAPINLACNKRIATGVGNTATYPFTVPTGCVAVVTGVNVTGIPMPWTDGGGGIEGLQPGSYTVLILDGSYQIGATSAGQAMWCNLLTWENQNGKADTHNYPIDGWSSNCPAN